MPYTQYDIFSCIPHRVVHYVAFRFFLKPGLAITGHDGEEEFIVRIAGFIATVVNHSIIIISQIPATLRSFVRGLTDS